MIVFKLMATQIPIAEHLNNNCTTTNDSTREP